MKKINVFIFLIVSLLTLASCNATTNEEKKLYTVFFEENGGTPVKDINDIEKGSAIELPNIEREGYIFRGWYTSNKFIKGTEVTNKTLIGKDITLHAKWDAIKYDLVLNLNGGKIESVYQDGVNKIEYGTTINLPEAKKEGFLFQGWYLNDKKIEEDVVINDDIVIDTKWIDINTLQKEYSINLELDGGLLYEYNSKESLMEDFLNDYSTFTGSKIDTTNFWDQSYRSFVGEGSFLDNEYYFDKWQFFLEYLATSTREDNKEYILKIVHQENMNYDEMNMARTIIRNEILAFFLNTERVVSNWGSIVSGNYAKEELQQGYLNYCQIDAPKTYETGKGIFLGEPIKEGYIFLGWYDNPEFTGQIYTEITSNEYGDRSFYALYGSI